MEEEAPIRHGLLRYANLRERQHFTLRPMPSWTSINLKILIPLALLQALQPQLDDQRVVEKVHSYKINKYGKFLFGLKSIASFFIGSCTYVGLGAASLNYACAVLLGIQPRLSFCLIGALFIFSMQVLNHFANKESVALNEPARAKFSTKRNKPSLLVLESLGQ